MTRRRRSRPRRRNQRRGNQISPVRFHLLLTSTLSGVTGTATVSMNPQFGGLAEIADQFDLFHFKTLRYRIHPMDPTDTTNQGVCYYPDVDIQTQTTAQLSESPLAAVQTPFCGVPSRWINVPSASLKGMLDWYKCTADAGAAEFESQGLLQFTGGLSDTIRVEFEGTVLFKNPVSSTLQFQRTIARAVKKGIVVLPSVEPEAPSPVKNGESLKHFPTCVCGRTGICCQFDDKTSLVGTSGSAGAINPNTPQAVTPAKFTLLPCALLKAKTRDSADGCLP